jgi:hypothetical protein
MNLTRDLKEFIELLNATGVEYLIIGGWTAGRLKDLADVEALEETAPHPDGSQ